MIHTKHSQRAEAEVQALSAARHPGVVELVDAADGVVRTRLVDGRALSDLGPLPAEEVAGLAAALATTLADLHDLGVVHGGLDATHVIVAGDGRPVLCSLGRGGAPAGDVEALGRLVTWLLERAPAERPAWWSRWAPRRRGLGPMLAPPAGPAMAAIAAEANADDPAQRPSARALATAIAERVPMARLPRPHAPAPLIPPAEVRPPWLRPSLRRAALVGAPSVIAAVALVWWVLSRPGAPAPPRPQLDRGVLSFGDARYAVGQEGDAVAVGRWDCQPRPTPVLLRPSTGEVFVFDDWAPAGRDVTARPLGRVLHARGVRAVPSSRTGCHHLEVVRDRGRPVRLPVPGNGAP